MHIRTWFPLEDVVDRAFACLYWEEAGDEQVEAFASRWGGLELEHFRQALQNGEGDDQVLAMFALGLTATVEAADLLVPFLSQGLRRQRWASALCLSLMHDPRVFAVVEELLLDGLDGEEYAQALQERDWDLLFELDWCGVMRWYEIQLLEHWETPTLCVTLKQAFAALWQMQQYPHIYRFAQAETYDALAYALGQRDDFTIVDELDLPPAHRALAMLYLALGHLHLSAGGSTGLMLLPGPLVGLPSRLVSDKAWQEAVAGELASRFGLSTEEQEACLRHFLAHKTSRESYGQISEALPAEEEEDEEMEDEDEREPLEAVPLCIYQEHTARIQSLAWSPDGAYLVSGSEDGTARVWQRETGATVVTFRGHTGSVNLVSWSPQDSRIVSGGSDGVVCLWDSRTGELLQTYHGHQSGIWGGLAWSPDGTRIASASLDRTAQVWDAFSGNMLVTYHGHTGIIASLAWSPDGTRIASGGGYPECMIHVWDATTGMLHLLYRDHERDEHRQRPLFGRVLHLHDKDLENWLREASSVHGLAWSPDGTTMASAGLRTVCRVWDAASGRNLVVSDRTEGPLAWSPNGLLLASPRFGHQVDVWDAMTNQTVISYHPPDMHEIKALRWSPDGKFLAASGTRRVPYGEAIIQIWEVVVSQRET